MAHRLNHFNNKKGHYPKDQPQQNYQQNTQFSNTPQQNIKNADVNSKMPRPIFPPTDEIITHEKSGFRKGLPTLPSPEQIFNSDNNYDAGPHFIRPSSIMINSVPKKTVFPLGAWITPLGSQIVHTVDVHAPLRCHRCKAYINAFFQFDGSRRVATCNICGMKFQIDEAVDKRNLDSTQIATKGVIDFRVKDKFYFRKRTDIVKLVICIEMSQPIIELGIFNTIIESIKSSIQNNQFEQKIRISVIYFSQEGVVFPKLKKSQNWKEYQPTEYIVKVTQNATFCCPLSDKEGLLDANLEKDKIIYLLDHVMAKGQSYYQKGRYSNSANYIAAIKCLKDSFETETGRIMLFSCLDPRSGKCSVRPRNQQQNKLPLKPLHTQFYEVSKQLLKSRIGVQHYIFTKDNMICHQLATTHFLSSQTGGPTHFYPGYVHDNHSQHLYYTIYKSLAKSYIYDLDYTCRVSNGLNLSSFCTANGLKQVRDVSLGCMDPSYSLGVLFEHQQKLQESYGAFLQFAMMYTNGSGERRIRVINYRYMISQKLDNMYDSVDYLAFANLLCRMYTSKLYISDPAKIREQFMTKLTAILGQYRYKCSNAGLKYSDLSAPPNLRIGLAYIHTIINHKIFTNPYKLTTDSRIAEILRINTLDFYSFAMRYYPKLYPLTMDIYDSTPVPGDFVQTQEQNEQDQQVAILPQNVPLTRKFFADTGVYLENNGEGLTILVPPNADQELLVQIFGTSDWEVIEQQGLPQLQESHNVRINNIVNELRRRNSENNGIYMPLTVKTPIKKGPFGELVNNVLKEDYHECNYYTFLDSLHRAVQNLSK